ncbi:MAG: ACP S-malonyltransferase [Oscillospiraceae bacterium]|nr:ACP S-malonyltransferase [Oscillospiraceae bacterium]
MKTVFLFSGQGSQYPGMGAELAEKSSAAKRIYECGSDIMGFDLAKKLSDSTPEELAQTRLSQPAIFTTSLLALAAARENGIENCAVAGHSLGEYAAMYASGVLGMEDAFKAIKLRSEAMAKAAEATGGAMAAIIGSDNETIAKICEEVNGFCAPANYNSPQQTVIAGEAAAIDEALAKFAELGKRGVKLAVSAAFHTKLMNSAAEEFKAAVAGFPFKTPDCDFYSNLYGKKLEDFSDMPSYLAAHICSPVKFTDELEAMNNAGIEAYVELGPGKVLTGLVKKTFRGTNAMQIENAETLEKALAALKG